MNTVFRGSLFVPVCFATYLTALFVVPMAAQAQAGNTPTGIDALAHNTTGSFNTADGWGALTTNTTGSNNTAIGLASFVSSSQNKEPLEKAVYVQH